METALHQWQETGSIPGCLRLGNCQGVRGKLDNAVLFLDLKLPGRVFVALGYDDERDEHTGPFALYQWCGDVVDLLKAFYACDSGNDSDCGP
jgi:hypothetical protein